MFQYNNKFNQIYHHYLILKFTTFESVIELNLNKFD